MADGALLRLARLAPKGVARAYLCEMARSIALADRARGRRAHPAALARRAVGDRRRPARHRRVHAAAELAAQDHGPALPRQRTCVGGAAIRARRSLPTLQELRQIFQLQQWDLANDDAAAEDARLRELQATVEASTAAASYEDLLELAGCSVVGRSEFNSYCENHEIYDFWTKDYVDGLAAHLAAARDERGVEVLEVVEVGAGDGRLSFFLRRALKKLGAERAVNVVATDSGQWRFAPRHEVKAASAEAAADGAHVALVAWMPMGVDWTSSWRQGRKRVIQRRFNGRRRTPPYEADGAKRELADPYAEAGKPFPSTTHDGLAVATFGGGCFWGLQLAFDREPGVVDFDRRLPRTPRRRPTSADVCDETTGHTEAVLVKYSPEIVSFARLAAVLFDVVGDPTTLNRVGRDRGTNYRTGMYCHSDAQLRDAEEAFDVEDRSWQSSGRKVVTEVKRAAVFWPAEAVHQRYLENGGRCGRPQSAARGCTDEIRCYGRAACLRNRLLPKTTHTLRSARRAGPTDDEPSLGVKGAWFAAELFGKAAALTKGAPAAPLSTAQPPRSVDEACKRLAADYEGADGPYFLTGIMDAACYDDDCEFADPFVSFKGRARFEENLANLGGGFISDEHPDASHGADGVEPRRSSW
ncbi:peptide-methionine (S)-S-oxide reductase [Aureococcus anophagefferens]|nr:peptide-methionine (S)-S-oxide reductase [Aureococcus anophagefferens]